MSLINDALKRASESDRNRQRPAQSRAPMQPAAHSGERSVSLILGVCIVIAMGLAGWVFGQWWQASHRVAPTVVQSAPAPVPVPAPASAPPVVAREVVAPPPQAVVAAPVVVAAPQPAPLPPARPAVKPWPAELKLMGIFFSKTNPRALINGRTVSVGDEVEGIRVTKIEHDQVTLEWDGQVKELIME